MISSIRTYLLVLVCLCLTASWGQNVERKIIIEKGMYSYVTIDDYSQIGTLHRGDVSAPLNEAKAFALPAGRGVSAETNPLAWDINENQLVAVNFLDHSLNDRNEAIKNIALNELREWGVGVETGDVIMQSVDQEMLSLNRPYLFIKKRSKYLSHFYFDGVWFENDYWMVITNNNELTIWNFSKENSWRQSGIKKFPVSNFFHLQVYKNELLMITNEGEIYAVDLKLMKQKQLKSVGFSLADVTLIEDRDNNGLLYIQNSQLNREKSLKEIISQSAINLIRE